MNDPFSYSARWGSVDLDCAFCMHQKYVQWPNLKKDYACTLHSISLAKVIDKNGYQEGEWFCSAFKDKGDANSSAVLEFNSVVKNLNNKILYGAYGDHKELKEIPFVQL